MHYRYVPAVVEAAAREHGLALVALHREVKFVALTEAVHSRIISEQTAALRARDEVRERFTALSLRGSPADFIVHQLAQTLGAAVVLENLAHEVVAAEVPPAAEEELFATWEASSRARAPARRAAPAREAARRGPTSGSSCPSRPAASAGGTSSRCPGRRIPPAARACSSRAPSRWRSGGSPTATPTSGCASAASAWSTGCSPGGSPGSAVRRRGSRRPACPSTARTSTASWRRVRRFRRGAPDAAARALGGRAIDGVARDSAGAASAAGAPASCCCRCRPSSRMPRRARFASALVGGEAASVDRLVLAVGGVADGLDGLLGSVQEAIDLARGARPTGARGVVLRRADDRPLMRLVTSLRDDHRLLRHSERMLAPLIEYDLARGGDLLSVLGAMLAHPGNRTAAASASHLSRSVFYQRLALIGDLLGVDLDDGEALTALHLALLVRRSAAR